MKEKLAKEGQTLMLASNVKASSFLADVNGNKLTEMEETTSCTDDNGDPIYSFDETVLESCSRSFLCGSGYNVKTSWEITT